MTLKLIASDLDHPDVDRRTWALEERHTVKIGCSVGPGQIQVDWDPEVAPRHAEVIWEHGRLVVQQLLDGTQGQPLYYAGRAAEAFQVVPGEGFVIGNTVFRLEGSTEATTPEEKSSRNGASPPPKTNTLVSTDEQVQFLRDLLDVYDSEDPDLFAKRVQRVVQEAIAAHQVTLVKVITKEGKQRLEQFGGPVTEHDQICEKLVYQACELDDYQSYCWAGRRPDPEFPPVEGMQWAACMPVVSNKEEEKGRVVIYLAGKYPVEEGGVKKCAVSKNQQVFLHCVARVLSGARTIYDLRRCRDWMQVFFPKPIRDLIHLKDPEDIIKSEKAEVAVLFCDIRGSCQLAETGANDLKQSWERLRTALRVMTQAISDRSGAIGDFQGDAAMGFWGWPAENGYQDLKQSVRDACNAANTLRERFSEKEQDESGLSGMNCGIGVAAGPVWAGRLGTNVQRKISVFGPVVNLAARLETMTKQLGVSILIDETSRDLLKQADEKLSQQTRYLAKVVPAGMRTPIKVFELMPPAAQQTLQQANLKKFREGCEAVFEKRDWPLARKFLEPLRGIDGPAKFLLEQMNGKDRPPAGWDGAFWLTKK